MELFREKMVSFLLRRGLKNGLYIFLLGIFGYILNVVFGVFSNKWVTVIELLSVVIGLTIMNLFWVLEVSETRE